MKKLLRRRPSAAMIVAIVALVAALGGTAVAAGKIGLSSLSNGAKNKTVGVGKLTYVTQTVQAVQANQPLPTQNCPSGLKPIGGGIRLSDPSNSFIADSFPTSSGWGGNVFFQNPSQQATITAICAVSRAVTGSP